MVVGISSHEHQTREYTLVVELQNVDRNRAGTASTNDTSGAGTVSMSVLESAELARFDPKVSHDETWTLKHDVTPTLSGENLRLTYFLYRGSPPDEPSVANAYREVHLWVNVSKAGE